MIEGMKSLKNPIKEFHGKCSCKEWYAEYHIAFKKFECLCLNCYEKFFMVMQDEFDYKNMKTPREES